MKTTHSLDRRALPATADLPALLGGVLDVAVALAATDFGNIQLLDGEGRLRIVAQRGFPDWWVDYWNAESEANEHGSCGKALAGGERVIVEDVETSPIFVGTPGLEIQRRAGIRAIQSTPLRGRSGRILGMFSTHFREPHRPDASTLKLLDLLAVHAATLVERARTDQASQELNRQFQSIIETTADGFWVVGEDGHLVDANEIYAMRSGYSRAELRTMHIADLEAQEIPDEVQEHRTRVRRDGRDIFETVHRAKSGEVWPVEVSVCYRPESGGRYFAFLRDISERKRLQRVLVASEEKYRLIVDTAYEGVVITSLEGRYTYVNQRFAEMLGHPVSDVIGRSHKEFTFDDWEPIADEVRQVLGESKFVHGEFLFRRRDGTALWTSFNARAIHDEAGRHVANIGMHTDITERKQAEEALRATENRLRRAQEAGQVGTWEWDVLSGANHWSDEAFRLYGLEVGSVAPSFEAWLASVHPDDRATSSARVRAAQERAQDIECEWRTLRNDRYLMSRGRPEFDADGHLRRYLGVVIDMTDRKKTLQTLEHTRLMLAEAERIAHLGSFEFDVDTGQTLWSEEEYRIYGLDPSGPSPSFEELLARHIHPEDVDKLRDAMSGMLQRHEYYELTHRIVRPDGSVRWVHNLAHPYFDAQGQLRRYFGTSQDITERRQQQAAADRHAELLQSLWRQQVAVQTAAAFAHELNQPLLSITAYNEVATRALASGPSQASQLARAVEGSRQQALQAGRVLHELLDHLHNGPGEAVAFDLNALVRTVVDKTHNGAATRFSAKINLERGLPPVLGNPLQTEKALANLLLNGIEAMEAAAVAATAFVITVRTHRDRSMAHVTVRDCGPGLDADAAARLFSPFFSTKAHGLGLGLTISRALIEAQGGQLWFDPEGHPGAVFHFTLPFADE